MGVLPATARTTSWWLPKLCVLSVLLGTAACQEPLSSEECQDLLTHYTEMQIEQARPSTSTRERLELKRAAQTKAQLDPEFARCSSAVSRTQFECAMQAPSADQIERCLL